MGRMGNISEKIRKTTGRNIPTQKKDTEIAEPKWTTLMEKWGTDMEKEEINYAYKKRDRTTKRD